MQIRLGRGRHYSSGLLCVGIGIRHSAPVAYPSWTVFLDPGNGTCLGAERWLVSERECRSDSESVGPVLEGHNGSVVLAPWAKE